MENSAKINAKPRVFGSENQKALCMIDREAALQNAGKSSETTPEALNPTVPDNLIEKEELWEFELDLLGAAAVPEKLQQILERAPNPESATAQFLMGYLASYENKSI